jgi:hypothetical protein
MWRSRTKNDLIIEVWEKLDCENVGAKEIIAIENAVREKFGDAAVDSPMIVARLLADEGAEMRHSEIMKLYVDRSQETTYDAVFRNILRFENFERAVSTIRNLENARRKYLDEGDKLGTRLTRETALRGKKQLLSAVEKTKVSIEVKQKNTEIAEWLTIWLQSPELFESWIGLRTRSADFIAKFGDLEK